MVDLLGFFEIANKLKWTERNGWIAKIKVKEHESVAGHSYLTALICMVIAEQKGLNTNKVLKMALLHDLAESITGDYMPSELTKKTKNDKEVKAMKNILGKLPPNIRISYSRLWKDYKDMSSKEAKLVHQIDRLEMALQANDYLKKGYSHQLLEQFFLSARAGIRDKELLKILNSLK
ncbi:MAG: phosphohydrolase [Thaumarchaeota archaeon]|nr:phosphohydrolase [Nitrososphaerota archaeon]|tara:strand:- start:1259 stop:1789 length:531 start_codon:yes stop_codon:yes gene_type:complete